MNTWYKTKFHSLSLALFANVFATFGFGAWESGSSVPDLESFGLEGDVPELVGKVTYVDFWASWCAPCKKTFPVMDSLYQDYGDKGFQVVAISVDANKKAMDKFLAKSKPTFSIVRDAGQKLVAETGLEKMPTSYLVDSRGTVRYIHHGWDGKASEEELKAQIEELLEEK